MFVVDADLCQRLANLCFLAKQDTLRGNSNCRHPSPPASLLGGELSPALNLEEKLENLNMPPRLGDVFAPGIETVPAQEYAMATRGLTKGQRNLRRKRLIILRILDDRNPLLVLMGGDSSQTLEHLVSLDIKPAFVCPAVRQQRTPVGVCMQ